MTTTTPASGAGLPILVVTAGGGAEEKARRIGAFAYLHKPLERIEQAVATAGALARLPENSQAPEALLSRYSTVRQFLPLLLETTAPHATNGGMAVPAAWDFLHRLERTESPPIHEAPLRIVTPACRRLVVRPVGPVLGLVSPAAK